MRGHPPTPTTMSPQQGCSTLGHDCGVRSHSFPFYIPPDLFSLFKRLDPEGQVSWPPLCTGMCVRVCTVVHVGVFLDSSVVLHLISF